MTDTPLKPCPFCGSEPEETGWADPDSLMIYCDNGDCESAPLVLGDTADEAFEGWNTRHTPAITDEDVERAAQAVSAVKGWAPKELGIGPKIARAALNAYRENRS